MWLWRFTSEDLTALMFICGRKSVAQEGSGKSVYALIWEKAHHEMVFILDAFGPSWTLPSSPYKLVPVIEEVGLKIVLAKWANCIGELDPNQKMRYFAFCRLIASNCLLGPWIFREPRAGFKNTRGSGSERLQSRITSSSQWSFQTVMKVCI